MGSSLAKIPLKWIRYLLDRVLFLVGAVSFSQIPGFIAHYQQRLGGHLDEARRDLADYQRIADDLAGGSLSELITQYLQSVDDRMVRVGELIVAKLDRVETLQEALQALTDASVWTKLYQFFRVVDYEIAARTLQNYEMNVPLTVEGLSYALVGALLVSLFYHGLARGGAKGAQRLRQRWNRRHQHPTRPKDTKLPKS